MNTPSNVYVERPRSENPVSPLEALDVERRRSSQGKEGALEKREGDGGGEPSAPGSKWTVSL